MKFSNYNHYTDLKDDKKFVVANFLHGTIVIYENDARLKAKEVLKGRTNELTNSFINNKFLINQSIDEGLLLTQYQDQIIQQKDTLFLVIFVTGQCNFRCKYCCEEYKEPELSQEIQNKLITFIQANLSTYKLLRIEWFGGEPLMAVNTIEYLSNRFIAICKENKVQYFASTTTNGYFLNAQMLKRLKKCRVVSYQVTLDGLQGSHDKQRTMQNNKGTWDTIVKNLKQIRDSSTSSTFNIMIRTNITYDIHREREGYIKFLYEEFGEDRRFHFLWKLAEDWGNMNENNKYILCGIDEFEEVVQVANKHNLRSRFYSENFKPGGRVCEASKKNSLIVFSDGSIGKCARNVNPDISRIGNINDLIKNPEKYLNCTFEKPIISSKCRTCRILPMCFGNSCPFVEEALCGYEMENIDFIMECIAKTDDTCLRV